MICDDLEGWDGGSLGGKSKAWDICICIADSVCYITKTNTTL